MKKKNTISGLTIILVLLYFITMMDTTNMKFYLPLRYMTIVIIVIFIAIGNKVDIVLRKKYRSFNITMFLYFVVVFTLSCMNRSQISSRNIILSSIVYIAILFEALFLFEYLSEKGKIAQLTKVFEIMTLVIIVINDVSLFLIPSIRTAGNYFIGTKFNVSYLHIQFLVFYLINKKEKSNKIFVLLFTMYSLFVINTVDCGVGLIGTILFLVLYMIIKKSKKLRSPIAVLVTIAISCSFFWWYDRILENAGVQYFIEDVMNRSLTLTGRTEIYSNLFSLMENHWLTGYGYGSFYEICVRYLGYANTQNGLMNIVLELGIFGGALFLSLVYISFKQVKKCSWNECGIAAFAIVYMYAILASVEVTFMLSFFTLTIYIYAMMSENRKGQDQ